MRSVLTVAAVVLLTTATTDAQTLIPAESVPQLQRVNVWSDELPLADPGPGPAPARILTPRATDSMNVEPLPEPQRQESRNSGRLGAVPVIDAYSRPLVPASRPDSWDLIHQRAWNQAEERRLRIAERQRLGISLSRPVWQPTPYTSGPLTGPSPQAVPVAPVPAVPYPAEPPTSEVNDRYDSLSQSYDDAYDSYDSYFSTEP